MIIRGLALVFGVMALQVHADYSKQYWEARELEARKQESDEKAREPQQRQLDASNAKIEAERNRVIHIGYECNDGGRPRFSQVPCSRSKTKVAPTISSSGNVGAAIVSVPVIQTDVYSTIGCEEGKAAAARAVTFVERDRAAAYMTRYCR